MDSPGVAMELVYTKLVKIKIVYKNGLQDMYVYIHF